MASCECSPTFQILSFCPNCKSKDFVNYNDCFFCFNCKNKILNLDYNPELIKAQKEDNKPSFYKKEISEVLSYIVKSRDNFQCVNCQKSGVVIHHILSLKRGGKTEIDNLVFLCSKCHEMVHQESSFYKYFITHFQSIILLKKKFSNFEDIKPLTNFEKFLNKLYKCKKNPSVLAGKYKTESGYYSQVYKDKDLKNPFIHPISCKCAYCDKLSCMDLRKREAHIFLKPYFDYSKRNGSRCSHAVFGFPRIKKEEITKDFIKQMRSKMRKCRKEIIGQNNLLRVVGVLDVSYNKEDKTFYFHWHMALFFPHWHRGNLKYQEIRDITKKYDMTFTRFESHTKQGNLFKNPIKVLDYISKRFAGILEHPTQEEKKYSKYSDFFTDKEYFDLFHREKRLFTWGYSKKERLFLLSQAKRDFLCSIIGNNHKYFIEEMGEIDKQDIVFFVEEASNFKKPDIPDNIHQNAEIPYINPYL